ncbi:MAG: hypothetical protein ACPGO6_04740 [Candidatus Poseidoniaceae archaeon]|mgnify:FL=1|jgi:5S rRNA maturation endonuclease (ribonuclease M5)|tara:strand:- start:1157 stop:1636 length:480 start_codon:yes stop_codon:yes gene_type:complete
MAGQNRNDGSGLGNYELRFSNAGQAIGEARRKNRLYNWPIIVEGPRDKRALLALGFTGPVEVLNRGWTIERVVAHLYETYGTRNESTGGSSVCLLMDWDRTGGRLQRKLANLMQSFDMSVDQEIRTILQKNLKPETRVVESLYGMADRLRYHITQEDRL